MKKRRRGRYRMDSNVLIKRTGLLWVIDGPNHTGYVQVLTAQGGASAYATDWFGNRLKGLGPLLTEVSTEELVSKLHEDRAGVLARLQHRVSEAFDRHRAHELLMPRRPFSAAVRALLAGADADALARALVQQPCVVARETIREEKERTYKLIGAFFEVLVRWDAGGRLKEFVLWDRAHGENVRGERLSIGKELDEAVVAKSLLRALPGDKAEVKIGAEAVRRDIQSLSVSPAELVIALDRRPLLVDAIVEGKPFVSLGAYWGDSDFEYIEVDADHRLSIARVTFRRREQDGSIYSAWHVSDTGDSIALLAAGYDPDRVATAAPLRAIARKLADLPEREPTFTVVSTGPWIDGGCRRHLQVGTEHVALDRRNPSNPRGWVSVRHIDRDGRTLSEMKDKDGTDMEVQTALKAELRRYTEMELDARELLSRPSPAALAGRKERQ